MTGTTAGEHPVRRRMARRVAQGIVTAAAALAVAGVASGAARADTTNLLPNGNFEGTDGSGSTSGFKAQGAQLSLASDGVGGGHAGKVTHTTTATSYQLYAAPRPVSNASQGTQYSAGGEVRSDTPGKTVCLQLREISSAGAQIGSTHHCQQVTSSWAALGTVTYTAKQSGSSISFQLRQTGAQSGDSFEADNLTLTGASPSPPPSTLVALWHMDETSGTTMYDSVGSNNGTLNGSVTVGQPGFSGTAYRFHGSTSKGYVSVPSADALNPDTSDFSFTIHVNTTTTPTSGDYDLMRKGAYSSTTAYQEYKMEIQQSGQASCAFRGTTGHAQIIAGPSVVDGEWHTLTCSKTSSGITLTVDGQSFSVSAQIGSISNTSPVVFGAHPSFDYYNGLLDEASITKG